jgi:3-oxoacyl-[acyl-carrier-protein] synthase II
VRVFVTGMGALTSIGNDVGSMFNGLLENRSGIRRFAEWERYNGLNCHLGAPVGDYDIQKIPRAARRTMSRMSEMATLATGQALAQAQLSDPSSERTVLLMGSTSGSPQTLEVYFKQLFERGGPQGQLSTSFFKVMNHSVAANVAAGLGYKGALLSPASACSTSSQAMILGWELLQTGLYDCVIAGGADELHYMSAAIFDIVFAASRNYNHRPEVASRPFDRDRDGLVVSEGAGVLVMETEERIRQRGARPLAEFLGGAYYCDGSHMSQSSAEAMQKTMSIALQRCQLQPEQIDYVSAHATGTLQGDAEEAQTISKIFADRVPVSSLKGHMGHSLAACGAVEAIASILMMQSGTIVPTRNLDNPDALCLGLDLVRERRKARLSRILSNNFAFGGMNTSLILSAVEG